MPSSPSIGQQESRSSRSSFLDVPWNFLSLRDSPSPSDLIFVLAGLPERKTFALELFQQGIAPRLILSVGRFEVRQMDRFGFRDLNLREKVAGMVPRERHFFIELSGTSRAIVLAGIPQIGTFAELSALATCLAAQQAHSLLIISTSIHLRRVRWCCRRIPGLREKKNLLRSGSRRIEFLPPLPLVAPLRSLVLPRRRIHQAPSLPRPLPPKLILAFVAAAFRPACLVPSQFQLVFLD